MFTPEHWWLAVGFAGQAVFTARVVVQWIASEKKGESIVPIAYWYLSTIGGMMLLVYALYRRDPVIISGQLFGVVVYGRNLVLIHRRQAGKRSETEDAPPVAGTTRRAA